MKVIGVNPVQALVVPRVIAATFVALMLYSVVAVVGLSGSYFFVVYVQNVTPGAFAAGLTLNLAATVVVGSAVVSTPRSGELSAPLQLARASAHSVAATIR